MIQSAARITSRLCSITISEWPRSSSRRNACISLAMSSKCRPVVGSSNMKSGRVRAAAGGFALRRFGEEAGQLQALRLAARQRRHRLAELHVFEPDIDDRLQHAQHFAVVAKSATASLTVSSSTSATLSGRPAALDLHFEHLRRDSAGRRNPGSAGRRRSGTAFRRARSPSRRRSGSGRRPS